MRFFLKFISCVWRIDLKWFQNDSDSLKVRKLKEKNILTHPEGFIGYPRPLKVPVHIPVAKVLGSEILSNHIILVLNYHF